MCILPQNNNNNDTKRGDFCSAHDEVTMGGLILLHESENWKNIYLKQLILDIKQNYTKL